MWIFDTFHFFIFSFFYKYRVLFRLKAHVKTQEVYGQEEWWPYVDDYLNRAHEMWTARKSSGGGGSGGGGSGGGGSGGGGAREEEGAGDERMAEEKKKSEKSEKSESTKQATIVKKEEEIEEEVEVVEEEETFNSFVRESIWSPVVETYSWVSENQVTVDTILHRLGDVGGGILGGTIGVIVFVLSAVGSTVGAGASIVLFFLFLNTMLTNDGAFVVVRLLLCVCCCCVCVSV